MGPFLDRDSDDDNDNDDDSDDSDENLEEWLNNSGKFTVLTCTTLPTYFTVYFIHYVRGNTESVFHNFSSNLRNRYFFSFYRER